MKKITFLFLLALLPLMASAAIEVDGVYYYIYNGSKKEATVAPSDTKYAGDINILPAVTYEGVTYTVTKIYDRAFEGCHNVTSVTIPNSVTTIGEWAFYYCTGLTSITIPSSVTDLGWCAFSCCSSLTSISVESGNPNYDSRNNCNAIIETATNTLIVGCKNTVIPNNVTEIRNEAFQDCSVLKSITIPNNVTSIGGNAFDNCVNLTSFTCKAISVPATGNNVFYNVPQSRATLYVLNSTLDSYKNTSPWSRFGSILALPEPTLRGDVNGDGVVNGTDIQAIINLIVESQYDEKADVNEDGQVNGTDIQEVINIIVEGE